MKVGDVSRFISDNVGLLPLKTPYGKAYAVKVGEITPCFIPDVKKVGGLLQLNFYTSVIIKSFEISLRDEGVSDSVLNSPLFISHSYNIQDFPGFHFGNENGEDELNYWIEYVLRTVSALPDTQDRFVDLMSDIKKSQDFFKSYVLWGNSDAKKKFDIFIRWAAERYNIQIIS